MEYAYKALNGQGTTEAGNISAVSEDAAIKELQSKGFIITSLTATQSEDFGAGIIKHLPFLNKASTKDLVMLSRQIATLFEAQVSALRVFRLLAEQAEKPVLRDALIGVADEIQGGTSISASLEKFPQVFSPFYVSMVRAGEESGKLDQTFEFLADSIERSYAVVSKVKNALIYPAFIVFTFVTVMILMLVFVIPKITDIITESGETLPWVTRVVLGISDFFVTYGIFMLVGAIIAGFFIGRYVMTKEGKAAVSAFRLKIPVMGNLYRKLFLSRIADNINVMLSSGVSVPRALEITSQVVDDTLYSAMLVEITEAVKSGSPISQAFARYPEYVPRIMVQMLQIGEETGEVGKMSDRLAKFYTREVSNAVDTLVSLIEPIMIILLAVGVGGLLAAVLLPLYNSTSSI